MKYLLLGSASNPSLESIEMRSVSLVTVNGSIKAINRHNKSVIPQVHFISKAFFGNKYVNQKDFHGLHAEEIVFCGYFPLFGLCKPSKGNIERFKNQSKFAHARTLKKLNWNFASVIWFQRNHFYKRLEELLPDIDTRRLIIGKQPSTGILALIHLLSARPEADIILAGFSIDSIDKQFPPMKNFRKSRHLFTDLAILEALVENKYGVYTTEEKVNELANVPLYN